MVNTGGLGDLAFKCYEKSRKTTAIMAVALATKTSVPFTYAIIENTEPLSELHPMHSLVS